MKLTNGAKKGMTVRQHDRGRDWQKKNETDRYWNKAASEWRPFTKKEKK